MINVNISEPKFKQEFLELFKVYIMNFKSP